MEHRPLARRCPDMRVLVLILALAASACAAAPPRSPESETASACSQTASALEVHTCGPDVDAVRDRRTGG